MNFYLNSNFYAVFVRVKDITLVVTVIDPAGFADRSGPLRLPVHGDRDELHDNRSPAGGQAQPLLARPLLE